MSSFTLITRSERRFSYRFRFWLASLGRRTTMASDLDTLSDHMRRDIGIERDPLDQMEIRTLHDAMRYSS